jgi:predicted O-methyltransferase YrrM
MNTLHAERVRAMLDALHELAAGDHERWENRKTEPPAENAAGEPEPLVRMGEFYLSVSREEGELLYLLARAANARNIVEFGASFGISTLYLAAAAQDNDGHVTSTEAHPDKCAAVRDHLDRAGLSERLTLLEGDARETLKSIEGPVDLVLLDGWKTMYLPVYELLRPHMRDGTVIAADNWRHEGTKSYVEAIQNPNSGLTTYFAGDMAVSCVTG